ncbi:MAG: type IX secretion system protein PorQ [Bacteroidales bacterium]
MKNILNLFAVLIMLTAPGRVLAQQSGRAYEFLGLPATARTTALGGYAIPDMEQDLGMALVFPSLLNPDMTGQLSMNFVDYFSDINYGTVSFSHFFQKAGTFSASLQYVDYGTFTEADETGQTHGTFSAGDYSLMIGWGRRLSNHWSIGSNLKTIYSSYYEYNSFGLALDVSLTYQDAARNLAAGIVARNMGRQLVHYTNQNTESLPFDLMIGVSKKLDNAPFRLSLITHNLHRYRLDYPSMISLPDEMFDEQPTGESSQDKLSEIGDNLMRHAVLGLEFMPGRSFSFRVGYNYRRRQEMKVDTRLSTVGFSWGFGIKISRFHFSYGRSNYHLAGAPNHISISTNLKDLFQQSEAPSE